MRNIPKQNGGTIVWDTDDWKAGIGPGGFFGSSTATSLRQNTNFGFARIDSIDPFTTNGALSPGILNSTNATNSSSMVGTCVAFEMINDTTGIGVDSGGETFSVNTSTNTVTAIGLIAGTAPKGQDAILYRHKNNSTSVYVTSLFYSYYNNTNWNVGVVTDVSSPVNNDTFMSSLPTTPMDIASASPADGKNTDQYSTSNPVPHPMCIGADGVLYIGSGRYIHAYDGVGSSSDTYGKFSSRVLTLPAGFQVTAMLKSGTSLIVVGNLFGTSSTTGGTGQALAYIWNYLDLDVSQVIPLEDTFVSCAFMWKGSPTVITSGPIGKNGRIKIKVLSGNSVRKVFDFGLYTDLPTYRGVVVQDDILYMNCAGKLITYGNRYEPSNAINYIGTVGTGTTSGVLFWSEISSCFAGSAGTQQFYLINKNGNGHGAGKAYGFAYPLSLPQDKIARMVEARVWYYSSLSAGGTNGQFSLSFNFDLVANPTGVVSNLSSVSTPLIKKYTQDTASVQLNKQFSLIQPYFDWSAGSGGNSPQVAKVEVDYILEELNN